MEKQLEEKNNFTRVGKIRAAHGIRGELFLISFSKQFDWLAEVSNARLVKKVPMKTDSKDRNEDGKNTWEEEIGEFEIEKSRKHKVGFILKLKNIDTRDQAESYVGSQFEVSSELLNSPAQDGSYYLRAIKGFSVLDKNANKLGAIIGFSSNGVQDLIQVATETAEVSIPYVDDFILKKNFKESWIKMDLPEGLFGDS